MKMKLNNSAPPSAVALGTVSFGSVIPRDTSFAILDAYAEAGGNFIDTAHVYSAWEEGGEGASERTVGAWLRERGVRGQMVVGTKGGHPPLSDFFAPRLAAHEIEQDLNESLDRLGVEAIDLYWLHRDDPARPVGEIMEALAVFVRDGRVRNLGVSNWTTGRIEAANAYAASHALPPIVASQPRWAYATRVHELPPADNTLDVDEETRQWHCRSGLAMVPFTAQAKGFFGEANTAWRLAGQRGPQPVGSRYDDPANHRRLAAAVALAQVKGCTANQIALAYLTHQPFPCHPIAGTSKPERIADAVGAGAVSLGPEEMEQLRNA